jgi:protein-L-isoaspartate O-methyltransferase
MTAFLAGFFRLLGLCMGLLLGPFLLAQILLRVLRRLHPQPMPAYLARHLHSPMRSRLFGEPELIVERAGVTPGMRVLEVGPGSGYFTMLLARRVAEQGAGGSVTCVEIQPGMIEILRRSLNTAQIRNVEIVQGDARQLPFPQESFDLVFLACVVGETPGLVTMFRECVRVLKPGGILAVTEQVSDPDFRSLGSIDRLAEGVGLEDAGHAGLPWWGYTARYRKPV